MTGTETSDREFLDTLRRKGSMSVSELTDHFEVTPTAVRQRLNRLMGQGLVERSVQKSGRGRPSHAYSVTEKARRQAATNASDLTLVLWQEIREISDPEVRRGLLKRLAARLAELYGEEVDGGSVEERMLSLQSLLDKRGVNFEVEQNGPLPILKAVDCPYPQLAEVDRGVCAMEKLLLSELIDDNLRLSECRLDGHECCRFETT